jgi:hypothetical protein
LGRERRRRATGVKLHGRGVFVLGLDLALFFGIHA